MVRIEDLIYAIRAAREVMGTERWDWDELEAFLAGSLSFSADVDEVLDLLRGEARMTEAMKARYIARNPAIVYHPPTN